MCVNNNKIIIKSNKNRHSIFHYNTSYFMQFLLLHLNATCTENNPNQESNVYCYARMYTCDHLMLVLIDIL